MMLMKPTGGGIVVAVMGPPLMAPSSVIWLPSKRAPEKVLSALAEQPQQPPGLRPWNRSETGAPAFKAFRESGKLFVTANFLPLTHRSGRPASSPHQIVVDVPS